MLHGTMVKSRTPTTSHCGTTRTERRRRLRCLTMTTMSKRSRRTQSGTLRTLTTGRRTQHLDPECHTWQLQMTALLTIFQRSRCQSSTCDSWVQPLGPSHAPTPWLPHRLPHDGPPHETPRRYNSRHCSHIRRRARQSTTSNSWVQRYPRKLNMRIHQPLAMLEPMEIISRSLN